MRCSGTVWRPLLIAAGVNALLAAAFFWSRPGGETTVRIEASGNTFRAFVDGRLHGPVIYNAPRSGGIGFRLSPSDAIPSLPRSTVRWIRVTESGTGAVLLEDSFEEERTPWLLTGRWTRADGAFWTTTGGVAATGHRPWRDYVLEVRFANLVDAEVFVRAQANGDAVGFALRPFRDFDSAFLLRKGNAPPHTQALAVVETDPLETTRTIAATALKWYPSLGLLLFGAALAFAAALLIGDRSHLLLECANSLARVSHSLVAAVAVVALGTLLAIAWIYGDRAPHVPDEVAYLFQAKIFASWHLTAPAPPFGDHLAFVVQDGDRWFSGYPFGHPLALAVGELVQAPWLVPPIVGALTIWCVYLLGRHLYGPLVGLAAAVLLFTSPFFQMTASNYMSHNTGALALVGATLFLLRPGAHARMSGFASGLLLGFLFNIRPLTATGVLIVFVVWLVLEWRPASNRRKNAARAGWWGAGFAVMIAAFLLYNHALTGSFLKTPYSYGTLSRDTVGFFGDHSFAAGVMNVETNLALLVLVLHGWPLFVGLLVVSLPFILGSTTRADYFLLAAVLSIVIAWTAYRGVFIMHGPRFWYEAVPLLVLLGARGIARFVETVGAAGDGVRGRLLPGKALDMRAAAALVSTLAVALLVGNSLHGWTFARHDAFPPIHYVPRTMGELRGFNGADARLVRLAEKKQINHAVVFVRECVHWQCYGTVFWTNSPRLEGTIVWARDLGRARNAQLISSFPDRSAYLADYERRTILPLRLSSG